MKERERLMKLITGSQKKKSLSKFSNPKEITFFTDGFISSCDFSTYSQADESQTTPVTRRCNF